MAEVSQNIKYVKLDDGVSFSLVRTNPKLTTNTKLMYNGKKMYMESYTSSDLLNRTMYKNVAIRPNSTYKRDIANFLVGSGEQAYSVYQNFSDITISDSYDNQFETLYWCGAEYIESSFYSEEIGFIAPLYLREKLPNYFLIFRLDTPSNFNLKVNANGEKIDSKFDFKTDILDKAVLIKTFDLREGSVLGNYIHNYINQDTFEFDKSMYVNFSNGEVTYYGINKNNGVLQKKVENFEFELLKNDNPILKNDKWFTEGFERNNLIFPYIMNIEYVFDDDNFKNEGESYDFARYIGLYCNNIEFGEFSDFDELNTTEENIIYYFEDNKNILHRYVKKLNVNIDGSDIEDINKYVIKIDGKEINKFDKSLISGFEKDRISGYAEPLDINEGFINRAQYGFEILKPLEPGDWVGIEYDGHVECYFADDKNVDDVDVEKKYDMLIGEYEDFRFSVNEESTIKDIAEALVKSVNRNKKSKFEAKYSNNVVAFYAKKEGKEYNGSEIGGAKILMEASLLYNRKISIPVSDYIQHISGNNRPIEYISDSDDVVSAPNEDNILTNDEKSLFGDYYVDYFAGACDVDIDYKTDTYKNVFKIHFNEYEIFDVNRYLKTNNGDGRRITTNMIYIDAEGKIDYNYRIIIVEDAQNNTSDYDVSVSSTYNVEILDKFKANHGVLSWFPVKDFDFDINSSIYGNYSAFKYECETLLGNNINYKLSHHTTDTYADSDLYSTTEETKYLLNNLAKSPFINEYGEDLNTEYDYYNEQFQPDLCLLSKTAPYISKWGYYDEQKDSCENPYRLNVSKMFGVSNLSANMYLRNCDEKEYTHSMPYYMQFGNQNNGVEFYKKHYQYILSDEIYINNNKVKEDSDDFVDKNTLETFLDCVNYWINMFKKTDEDMFSYFFSGKKYGKRFDKKYSRMFGGNKFHNPSTLFRGVKFEIVRQFNGIEKKSSEYNDYKFSFVYIPVMIDTITFDSNVYFVKNDTFKFIVGIVFVNTMLGIHKHNIFNTNIDYFYKGFLYGACKNIIRPENPTPDISFNLVLNYNDAEGNPKKLDKIPLDIVHSEDIEKKYDVRVESNTFYMWRECAEKEKDEQEVLITTKRNINDIKLEDIFCELNESNITGTPNTENVDYIYSIESLDHKLLEIHNMFDDFEKDGEDGFGLYMSKYYEKYDVTIYKKKNYKYCGYISCEKNAPDIKIENSVFTDICDNKYEIIQDKGKLEDKYINIGYNVDISKLYLKSESLKNIFYNLDTESSVIYIRIYDVYDSDSKINNYYVCKDYSDYFNKVYNKENSINTDNIIVGYIKFNIENGYIEITSLKDLKDKIFCRGGNIENLRIDICIRDNFDSRFESLGYNNYFSIFDNISMCKITESINNDYNVKYYSTVEDNKYKIRVIEPDSIEIEDKYESFPIKITQKNKNVIGSFEINKKQNPDNIGIKVINRYSGFYNPIFNDILYYGDYTFTKSVNKEKYELAYSNTNIDYNFVDDYGKFGIIKNMYYHKTNISNSDNILNFENPIYPLIDEYAIDFREDYNIFSSSWDEGYFISQDDLENKSYCESIGSMKNGLCMFGSKYLNLPDYIFIDTFENGDVWDERISVDIRDNTDMEFMYKEINNRTVRYVLFIEKRLKRYLKEHLKDVFSKYINKNYSFGNKESIEDDVEEYVEKNLLKLYKLDKVYMYVKSDMMKIKDKNIENEYLKYMNKNNDIKIRDGFPSVYVNGKNVIKESKFTMSKINEFDRLIVYNLKQGYKESFGFGISIKLK